MGPTKMPARPQKTFIAPMESSVFSGLWTRARRSFNSFINAFALIESPPHPLLHGRDVDLVVMPARDLDVGVAQDVGHVAFTEAYLLEVDRSGAAEGVEVDARAFGQRLTTGRSEQHGEPQARPQSPVGVVDVRPHLQLSPTASLPSSRMHGGSPRRAGRTTRCERGSPGPC